MAAPSPNWIDGALSQIAVAVVSAVIGVLATVWKLGRAASREDIKDRATFRQQMMDRVKVIEDRELALIVRFENRESTLLQQIADLHLRIEDLQGQATASLRRAEEAARKADQTRSIADEAIEKADKAQSAVERANGQNEFKRR